MTAVLNIVKDEKNKRYKLVIRPEVSGENDVVEIKLTKSEVRELESLDWDEE